MDVALIAIGSRGDLEPFLAIGQELTRRGHRVRVATHGDAAARVRACGLDYRPLPGTAAAFFADPEVVAAMRHRPSVARLDRALRSRRGARSATEEAARGLLIMRTHVADAVRGADLAVGGAGVGQVLAVGPLPAPVVLGSWYPDTPTRAFPAMGALRLPLGGAYHALTHRCSARAQRRALEPVAAAARRIAGSPGPGRAESPVLYLPSPVVLPQPADWPPGTAVVTGPWLTRGGLPTDGPPESWWAAGPPPVVISFGSLWPVVPPAWALDVVDRLRVAGHRVLLVGGPEIGSRSTRPDAVARCTTLDFAQDLPRARLLLHHGGFGTGTMALRAGVPQVVVPLFLDHPWWAARMRELGVAPPPVRLGAHRLTGRHRRGFVRRVERALSRVDDAMRARAAELGVLARRDDGVTAACDVLEERFDRSAAVREGAS